MARVTLTGGGFQDDNGNRLSNGYLILQPTLDFVDTTTSVVVASLPVTVLLDANGNVVGSPQVYANDTATPSSTAYRVTLYANTGTAVWKAPQTFIILSSVNPLNLGTWIPIP